MKRATPHSVGLVFAILIATWHAVWVLMVWAGVAQSFLDFIFRIHMISPLYMVSGFSLNASVILLLVTAAMGYIGGLAAGIAWNRCGPSERAL